ncbi:MAG: AAA family ATPase [Thermoplasmatales archaeon]|nr:AAA family ATPase [Thermoplasmatales archaeon]
MFGKRESTIIRDGAALGYDYVPEVLTHRESQMEELKTLLEPTFRYGRTRTAFLVGGVGSGKTATAKRFCYDAMKYAAKEGIAFDYAIINCRQKFSEFEVLLALVRHFDPNYPDRGFAPSEMFSAFKRHVAKSGKRLVVVLDEVDVLIRKGAGDLVYNMTRMGEEDPKMVVSLILIAQEYSLGQIDEASQSTFGRANLVRFPKYDGEQLHSIVKARADMALVPGGINPDAISLIADLAAGMGDARYAIELLDIAAREAEGKTLGVVTAEEVRSAKARTFSVVTESKLLDLDLNGRVTLLAIARAIKDKSYVSTADAQKTYEVVCEEYGVPARKGTQFWSYVKNLESQALIVTSMRSDEKTGGRSKHISLPDIPSKVLAEKLETIMDEETPPRLYNIRGGKTF